MAYSLCKKFKSMHPFNPPLVEPTLKYVEDFAAKNGKPTDVMMTGVTESIVEMALFIDDRVVETFHLKDGDLRDHYRDVVEFVGYGPRGFSELIYLEACDLAKAENRAIDDLVLGLSPDLFARIGEFLPSFMKYSLKIVVAPGLSGVTYALTFPDAP
jgi:hypothetical protein